MTGDLRQMSCSADQPLMYVALAECYVVVEHSSGGSGQAVVLQIEVALATCDGVKIEHYAAAAAEQGKGQDLVREQFVVAVVVRKLDEQETGHEQVDGVEVNGLVWHPHAGPS